MTTRDQQRDDATTPISSQSPETMDLVGADAQEDKDGGKSFDLRKVFEALTQTMASSVLASVGGGPPLLKAFW
jgi:hypothetical protein